MGTFTIITIILVPNFSAYVSDYIESEFINNVGLGVVIFIFTLFLLIVIKALGRAMTWTELAQLIKLLAYFVF